MNAKKYAAEAIGTFWLTFAGCGSAVIAAAFPQVGIGLVGVSLAFGLSATEIAWLEHVSVTTVRSHIRAVLSKLGVGSQLAAVAMARRAASPDPGSPDPGNFVNFDDAVRL